MVSAGSGTRHDRPRAQTEGRASPDQLESELPTSYTGWGATVVRADGAVVAARNVTILLVLGAVSLVLPRLRQTVAT